MTQKIQQVNNRFCWVLLVAFFAMHCAGPVAQVRFSEQATTSVYLDQHLVVLSENLTKTHAKRSFLPFNLTLAIKSVDVESLATIEALPQAALTLTMNPRQPRPGDFVVFEITSRRDTVIPQTLYVWGQKVQVYKTNEGYRAYAGVPLSAEAENYPVQIEATTEEFTKETASFRCPYAQVLLREFEDESLRVAKRFTKNRRYKKKRSTGPMTPFPLKEVIAYRVQPHPSKPLLSPTHFIWPKPGQINANFGSYRVYNKKLRSRHLGIDIEGRVGEPVKASQDGVVRYSGVQRASGQTLIVDHGGGILSYYLHLSRRLKKVGQRVEQGEMIGKVGSSGRVTGPHLHFAMSVNNRFIDPKQMIENQTLDFSDVESGLCEREDE